MVPAEQLTFVTSCFQAANPSISMSDSVQFYRSVDGLPLCPHCAQASLPWPRAQGDVLAGDRCGLGYLTAGMSQQRCFGYEGNRAELVTISVGRARVDDETAWQDRADSLLFRQPKREPPRV